MFLNSWSNILWFGSSGATRAQDDTTPENKDELKLENQNLEDDNLILVDEAEIRVTESSGDDDLDPNLKVLAINENEPPEVPEKSDIADASAPIEIKVIADDEISRLSLETIGEGNWSELKTLSIENNKIEKIDKEVYFRFIFLNTNVEIFKYSY